MKKYPIACVLAGVIVAASPLGRAQAGREVLPLAGAWSFELDRQDAGLKERWFQRPLTGRVRLPGSLPAQGIGDAVTSNTVWTGGIVDRSWFTAPEYARYRQPGNVKVPFWLQPEKYYVGAAWYQREIEIPAAWAGRRVALFLERPHWETRVWVDDRFIGANNALGTPHEHELGVGLAPGKHRLTLRVDNRLVVDVGHDSHSVSDHTQGNWNGMVGRLELLATAPVWIDDLQVYARFPRKSVIVKGRLGNLTAQPGRGVIELSARPKGAGKKPQTPLTRVEVAWDSRGGTFETEHPLGEDAVAWDEFNPALYRLEATLDGGRDAQVADFGWREFATAGTQFLLNGRKTYIRGTLECCIFPATGHPPTDEPSWERVIRAAQAHGLNNLRFHSWCPPEAAFAVADRRGFFLHVECSSWANSSTTIGDGKPVDQWIYAEADRILKYYGNHPSFVLMPYGNEPGGDHHKEFLAKWVAHYRAKDPRRLYTSGAGWPQIPENQFHVAPDPRIQAWGGGLKSRLNAQPPETRTDYRDYIRARGVPVISHEIGQWCVYPNFAEMRKYKGYLKPRNFEIFRDTLEAHHLGDQARLFLLASGKLQTLCYKEDIESALRTPGMGGFQLLDLHDFPGQGTALVGVLDPFWEAKGYVTAEEYSRFCNSTVPLARLGRRVFTTDQKLEADLEVAHFGPAPLPDCAAAWRLVADSGKLAAQGVLPAKTIPVDNAVALGTISVPLSAMPAPARYKLAVSLPAGGNSRRFQNDWDVWVYPPQVKASVPPGLTVVEDLNDTALAALEAGGKLLWLLPPSRVAPDPKLGKVALGFSSIFWNTAWTRRQPPHTLGILCDPKHPLFASFPTDYHSNWQWWYLITRAGAMILDGLPPALRPTVQVIDDWFTARRLGLVFEARVGQGKLLVCSIDLEHELKEDPVVRQFRHSLLEYMAGPRFRPRTQVSVTQLRTLVRTSKAVLETLGARVVRATSAEAGHEAELAADGNPDTMWHTAWTGNAPNFPHELVLEFTKPAPISGLTCLPRQDGNHNGWIRGYAVYVSQDGLEWGRPIAEGQFAEDAALKPIRWAQPQTVRFLKLQARSGVTSGPWASVAELDVIPAPE